MTPAANPTVDRGDDPDDLEALERYATALGDAVAVAVPRWVQRVVAERYHQWSGEPLPPPVDDAVREAAAAAADAVVEPMRVLLSADVDAQSANPLALLRAAITYPTRVLAGAGVPEVQRDADAVRLFPDDAYDLTPGAFADVDPDLHEPGLVWGAAKASVVLKRRKR